MHSVSRRILQQRQVRMRIDACRRRIDLSSPFPTFEVRRRACPVRRLSSQEPDKLALASVLILPWPVICHGCSGPISGLETEEMKYGIAWFLGVPTFLIILWFMFNHL